MFLYKVTTTGYKHDMTLLLNDMTTVETDTFMLFDFGYIKCVGMVFKGLHGLEVAGLLSIYFKCLV